MRRASPAVDLSMEVCTYIIHIFRFTRKKEIQFATRTLVKKRLDARSKQINRGEKKEGEGVHKN